MRETVRLLDRQYRYLVGQRPSRMIAAVPRFVHFVRHDPQLSPILDDLDAEMNGAIEQMRAADRRGRADLTTLWRQHADSIRALRPNDGEAEHFDAVCTFEAFEKMLRTDAWYMNPPTDELEIDPSHVGGIVRALRHWLDWAHPRGSTAARPEWLLPIHPELERVERQAKQALQRLRLRWKTLPGFCATRLSIVADQLQLAGADPVPSLGAFLQDFATEHVLGAAGIVLASEMLKKPGPGTYRDLFRQVRHDARLLHAELRHRLGLSLSRRRLVQRFAARCSQYDSARLRDVCAQPGASGKAEALLTSELARYLFDQGMDPLINAEVAGLRPDLFEPAKEWSFYVEAKQYRSYSRTTTLKYFRQVWETWGRLRDRYPVHEAFLVVFRLGGPALHFPAEVRYEDRRLVPILVDIADSLHAGSRATHSPIALSADDLRPLRINPSDGRERRAKRVAVPRRK